MEPHCFTTLATISTSAEPAEAGLLRQGSGQQTPHTPTRVGRWGFVRRRVSRHVLASVLVILFLGLLLPGRSSAGGNEGHRTLTILHTSEHHGTALPIERRGAPRVAGMAARATLVDSIRREVGDLLLVDSGDILIGSAMSSFFRGEPDIKAMNEMGYQAMAAGNHDFDFGLTHLGKLADLADFPLLCSNLQSARHALPCRGWAIVPVGDLTVGLLGLLGHRNFPDSFNREVASQLALTDPAETARRIARLLRSDHGADVIVAITHLETIEDLELLAAETGIDVIVGGHTEGFDGLRSLRREGPVEDLADPGPVFVKTHRQGRTVGRLDLTLVPRAGGGMAVARARARNLPVTEALEADATVQAMLDAYSRRLQADSGTVLGRSLVDLDGENARVRSRETNLGNLLADILRDRYRTDVALVNAGQIRGSIPPGPVDRKRVLSVLPFDSPSVTLTISGEALRLALENSASRLPSLNGRFLQVSGLTVTFDLAARPGARVREVHVGDRPLDPSRTYSVATDSFLADGGDGYTMFQSATDRLDRQLPMRDLLLEALARGPLKASVRGRIRFVDSSAAARAKRHEQFGRPSSTEEAPRPLAAILFSAMARRESGVVQDQAREPGCQHGACEHLFRDFSTASAQSFHTI